MTANAIAAPSPTSAADREAIAATIADYYLGWYDGDADRMARALHPRLAKRGWLREASGTPAVDGDDFSAMVEYTRRGQGRTTDPDRRRYEVRAVEVYDDIASACVYAVPYVDYLHLVRTDDGWRIMNALWRKP